MSGSERCELGGEASGGLAADLAHAAAGVAIAVGQAVAPRLATDPEADALDQVVLAAAAAQDLAHVDLVVAQQAEAQLAVGGQPDAVAEGAEGLTDWADEADRTRRAGQAVDAGRVAGGCFQLFELAMRPLDQLD